MQFLLGCGHIFQIPKIVAFGSFDYAVFFYKTKLFYGIVIMLNYCNYNVDHQVMELFSLLRSTLYGVSDNVKRWVVFGIVLNKALIRTIRPFVEQHVQIEYGNLKASHGIDTQSATGRLQHWPNLPTRQILLKYENINGNDRLPRVGRRYNYSVFDCRVTSYVDFAKLYVENFMVTFNAFDEHCDASAVLNLLGKVPVFSAAVQSAASDVRQARNAWAHCAFSDWDPVKFQQCFNEMEQLVKALCLPAVDERDLLTDLKDWATKGMCRKSPFLPQLTSLMSKDLYFEHYCKTGLSY